MSRDPSAIEREIQETRAELARTVDLIAERLSPKRAAGRGVTRVRESLGGVFQQEATNGHVPAASLDGETLESYEPREPPAIHAVPFEPGSTTPRELRKDRVAMAIATVVAVVGLFVVLKRRRG
jgi:hypothetical protein